MDIYYCDVGACGLVLPSESFADSFVGINLLPLYDGRTERLELDILHHLVADWPRDLFWIQSKEQ